MEPFVDANDENIYKAGIDAGYNQGFQKGFNEGLEEATKRLYIDAYLDGFKRGVLEGFRMTNLRVHCPLPVTTDSVQQSKYEEHDVVHHSDSAFSCIQSKITDYFKPKE